MKYLKTIIHYTNLLLFSIFIVIILRIFVVSFFQIPTVSMAPTIQGGDFILVNKLCYGARLFKNFDFLNGKEPKTFRVKGYSHIKRNDVVVFNMPYQRDIEQIKIDLSFFVIKRCIGLPGDTLSIVKGRYIINRGNVYGDTIAQKKLYQEKVGLTEEQRIVFPLDSLHPWTILDYGPIIIPSKGVKIHLTSFNRFFYKKIIEYETPKEWNDQIEYYVFKKNWFFMAGDNVKNSYDSRYWGVVPEECIIGQAILIISSRNLYDHNWRWNRFFQVIK